MGWSGAKGHRWGDTPQDIVGDVAEQYLKKDIEKASPLEKAALIPQLLANKLLRADIDEEFQAYWGRPANNWEFNNLIQVQLGTSGRTLCITSPISKKKKAVRKFTVSGMQGRR